MAPHAEDPVRVAYQPESWVTLKGASDKVPESVQANGKKRSLADVYVPGKTSVETHETYEFDYLRPRFPDLKWEPLKEVAYEDKGLLGDPQFRNLLDAATDVVDYVPKIGTEISGVNLKNLTDAQKNDLARLIATRGVVFFRNQHDFDIDAQRELGKYFGTLHKHATTSVPEREELEDVHVIYTTDKSVDQRALFSPTFLWHSDVSIRTWLVLTVN
jgi:sulfonate dioxygenase